MGRSTLRSLAKGNLGRLRGNLASSVFLGVLISSVALALCYFLHNQQKQLPALLKPTVASEGTVGEQLTNHGPGGDLDGTTHSEFMAHEFGAYKAAIDREMDLAFQRADYDEANCTTPLWDCEFGTELRVYVPGAYYMHETCGGVATEGLVGTKYMYFFSSRHTITKGGGRHEKTILPLPNPFQAASVHFRDEDFPRDPAWRPPPYSDFFARSEMEGILKGKPLVVILNKYVWQYYLGDRDSGKGEGSVANHFSVPVLRDMLDYLTPRYTVLYRRHTPKALMDKPEQDHPFGLKLNEKKMIRRVYPEVLFYEDFEDALDDPEDSNLLFFGLMSLSKRFLTAQGGNAVVGSYFGGTNIILIKGGRELYHGDYGYFHRFSNATVIETRADAAFLRELKRNM